MGQGRWLRGGDIDAAGCLRSLCARAARNGVSWVQIGLVEIAVGRTGRVLQNRRRHLLPPLGVAPRGSSVRPPIRLCRLELGTVAQHGMHNDGQASGERDACLAHCRSFGDSEGPVLEFQGRLVARQHDVGGFVQ